MSDSGLTRGAVYTVPIDGHAFTGATDMFCVTASTNTKVALREIRLGQYTEFGDAQAELLPIRIITGSTDTSGGGGVTPANVEGHTGAPAAISAALAPSASLASTASATVRWADSFNVAAGFLYSPLPMERLIVEPGETVVVRVGAPADSVTINGTLIFEEIGK